MVSIKVKRNITIALCLIGILCICSRAWDVISDPHSGKAWFDLAGIVVLTYLCFDRLAAYNHKMKKSHS